MTGWVGQTRGYSSASLQAYRGLPVLGAGFPIAAMLFRRVVFGREYRSGGEAKR